MIRRWNSALARLVACASVGLGMACFAAEPTADVSLDQYYGFLPVEIVKLSDRAHSIVPGDFNSDGRTDLAIVDNSKGHIDLLLQRAEKLDPVSVTAGRQINELDEHWRFENRKLPAEREVQALCGGDFNGDGKMDLAEFGAPDRLTIRFQPESGAWTATKEFRLPEVEARPWSIAGGDLNGDGLADLVVLGKTSTYQILQQADHTLAEPIVLRNTSPGLGLAMIADVNGDAKNDLFALANDEQKQPFCIRLQNNDGKLGPELRFRLEQPRGVVLHQMDDKPGVELIAIDARTNRVRMFEFDESPNHTKEEDSPIGRLVQYGFGGSEGDRDLDIGDLDGDGAADVVVTDPERAQLVVFMQRKGQLDLGTSYPSFLGASQVRVSDFDGNKAAEVAVLSSKENTVGVSRFENGRLSFPQAVGISGEVRVLETVDLNGDSRDEIAVVVKDSQGRGRSGGKYVLNVVSRDEEGAWKPFKIGGDESVELDLKSDPQRMMKVDANDDGRWDLLLTFDNGKNPKLLVQSEEGKLVAGGESGGIQLGEAKSGAVFSGMLDKRALLIAQGNFARHMKLDAEGKWQVLNQFNAGELNSKVEGVAALDLDGEAGNEVVLVDTGVNKLRIFRQSLMGFTAWRELEISSFPCRLVKVADLNGDGRQDLLLTGSNRFAVLYAGLAEPKLEELATFESQLKDVFLVDLVAGDLNSDGVADLAVFDARTNLVEILANRKEQGLVHALQFKIFDSKSFHGSSESGFQPREGSLADVTGDGRPDLLLLAHDRLLIYPQDPGEPAQPAATTAAQ
jgi:hypothetical protein